MLRRSAVHFISIVLLVFSAQAQQTAQPTPTIPSTSYPGLDQYRASRLAIYTDDFGELKRYREPDAALAATTPNENRVVFIGDSITDYWKLADYFPGKH
jgi:hypothetical protein